MCNGSDVQIQHMAISRFKNQQQSNFTDNKVELIRGGKQYFEVLHEMIENAKESIHLQTYIYDDDETGTRVAEALIDAANRNVKVYVLVDGYASQSLSRTFKDMLEGAGIHFRFFEPLFKSRHFYFGRRLHSKVVVTDTKYALVGGVNITDRYNDMPAEPAWLDFALFVEGPVVKEVCILCWKNWKGYPRRMKKTPCEEQESRFHFNSSETSKVRMRRNDWVRNKLEISNSYIEMFKNAKAHITILSSYVLPGSIFRKNLEKAIKRGVKVKMIISGESDIKMVKYAERYWYDWLMRNNIQIYEYTRTVLHGKLAVCDSEWMTIGSYNVNDLSAYASIELNFDVRDPRFINKVENVLQNIIEKDCILISKEEHLVRNRNLVKRFGQWFSYSIIRLTFNIFTFYYRHQKK